MVQYMLLDYIIRNLCFPGEVAVRLGTHPASAERRGGHCAGGISYCLGGAHSSNSSSM